MYRLLACYLRDHPKRVLLLFLFYIFIIVIRSIFYNSTVLELYLLLNSANWGCLLFTLLFNQQELSKEIRVDWTIVSKMLTNYSLERQTLITITSISPNQHPLPNSNSHQMMLSPNLQQPILITTTLLILIIIILRIKAIIMATQLPKQLVIVAIVPIATVVPTIRTWILAWLVMKMDDLISSI